MKMRDFKNWNFQSHMSFLSSSQVGQKAVVEGICFKLEKKPEDNQK